MTEALQKAISIGDCKISIERVCYYRTERRLEAWLISDSLVAPDTITRIEDNLTKMVPSGSRVCVHVRCNNTDAIISSEPETVIQRIQQYIGHDLPECAPVAAIAKWHISDNGDRLNLLIPERFKDLLKKTVQTVMQRYGIALELTVECDDDIKAEITENEKVYVRQKEPIKPKEEKEYMYKCVYGKQIPDGARLTLIEDVKADSGKVTVRGYMLPMTDEEAKRASDRRIRRIVADNTSAIMISKDIKDNDADKGLSSLLDKTIKSGEDVIIRGNVVTDKYNPGQFYIYPYDIATIKHEHRQDTAKNKRVELHLHTVMSEMDGLTSVKDAISYAAEWGHKAIAITDHGVVHAFPDAMGQAEKKGIKLLYGVEGYLVDDCDLYKLDEIKDLELVSVHARSVKLMGERYFVEIAAVRHLDNQELRLLINPGVPIPKELNDIYPDNIIAKQGTDINSALVSLSEFIGGAVVVTHCPDEFKALCDAAVRNSVDMEFNHIDTQRLVKYLYTAQIRDEELYKGSENDTAIDAVRETKERFELINRIFFDNGFEMPIMHGVEKKQGRRRGRNYYHIIILAKNRIGLKNMYKMVTYSHTESFEVVPLIPRSFLSVHRSGIILGTACERGELFRAMINGADDDELRKIASGYDYMEIQPIGNNAFMIRNGIARDEEELRDFNRRILSIADSLNKPTVATGDVHFLNPEDAIFRSIIMHAKHFKDVEQQAPLYFKTTDEMLTEFAYLGEDRAEEVVVTNPNMIADMCEPLTAYLNERGTYAPTFEGADDELTGMSMKRVHELYGEELPEIVQKRLEFELHSIISNCYATLYLTAQRLVSKSMSDGYLVGSRGSVGSSFVAYLAGITEVNPLPAHYLCPNCCHSDWDKGPYLCGADMPDKTCPICGAAYKKMGFDIPFETFLGFKGDKTPDIDLNFSGEYQPVAHEFTKEMFGAEHSYRAGVISTLQPKTAYGFVKSYCEEQGIDMTPAEMQRLVMGCVGVKRTTGQHPGGMVIVPPEYEAEDFMPLQYPANKKEGANLTTHFDFHAMNDKLVKLDILGHVDPTALRMMKDLTGLNPQDIPLDDPKTRALFSTSEPLEIDLSAIGCDVGTLGIPEYGTNFVRGILKDTRPTTIEELVRLAGLSHGTDVWAGNAQVLISKGKATLGEVIGTRDDIMIFLISLGSDPSLAFKTMESVRKGRGLTPEMEANLKSLKGLPDWYIDSCKMIKYMFPRAHAAAYLTMAFRVAYYKVHYPREFYAVYFTTRADDFDIEYCMGGADAVLKQMNKLNKELKDGTADSGGKTADKIKKLIPILEVLYEMNLRGIELMDIDINKSDAKRFLVVGDKLLPPFNAIQGLGEAMAEQIVNNRQRIKGDEPFTSVDEFKTVTGAGSAVVAKLTELGCLNGLKASDQLSFFD